MKKLDLSLYVITDEKLIKRDIACAVEEAIKGGATVIQYRAKEKTSRQMYQEAQKIKKVCKRYGIPLIINDRVDIALAVDADGVHVGQDDLDAEVVRRLIGSDKILGLSTKNLQHVEEANTLPIDYIGFGSVFQTSTKKDASFAGLENLKKAVEISLVPVVAIGGINHNNVKQVLKAGCSNIAVVSAVFKDENIRENSSSLKEVIQSFAK